MVEMKEQFVMPCSAVAVYVQTRPRRARRWGWQMAWMGGSTHSQRSRTHADGLAGGRRRWRFARLGSLAGVGATGRGAWLILGQYRCIWRSGIVVTIRDMRVIAPLADEQMKEGKGATPVEKP